MIRPSLWMIRPARSSFYPLPQQVQDADSIKKAKQASLFLKNYIPPTSYSLNTYLYPNVKRLAYKYLYIHKLLGLGITPLLCSIDKYTTIKTEIKLLTSSLSNKKMIL